MCSKRAEEHVEKFSLLKEKRPRGAFFLKKKNNKGEKEHPNHKRLFPPRGAPHYSSSEREKTYVIHTHTLAHAPGTRFESTKRISLENYSD